MVRRRVEIEYPDDAELGQSRQADGASSPNFYVSDLRGVRGQVKIYDIDEDEVEPSYPEPMYDEPYRLEAQRDPFAEAISDALAQVTRHYIDRGIAKAAPHVKAWVANKAVPAVKSTARSARSKLTKTRRAARQAELAQSATPDVAPTETTTELSTEVTEDKPSMSSQEAQTRVAAALLARAFSDEQLRIVFSARIDDGEFLAWMKFMDERTPAEAEERLHQVIESNPGFLEEFFATLLGGRHAEGQLSVSDERRVPETPSLTEAEL